MTTLTPYDFNWCVGTAIDNGTTTAGYTEQHSQASGLDISTATNNMQNIRDGADYRWVAQRRRDRLFRQEFRDHMGIAPKATPSILVSGDSITDGFGSADAAWPVTAPDSAVHGGWPAEMDDLLHQQNVLASVHKNGMPGWNLDNITNGMAAALTSAQPDVCVIHIGTNDAGGDLSTYANRYKALVQQILAAPTVKAIVCVLIPVASGGPVAYQNGARQVNTLVQGVVSGLANPKVVLADCTAAHTAAWTTYPGYQAPPYGRSTLDLMHPDQAGCHRTATAILTAAAPFLTGYTP